MAGLFGNFNYEKEGPGVDKNAPEKKGFIKFFEFYFKNFWKLAVNSVWYWLLTLPVLTGGLAAAGMTNITRNMAVDNHSFGTSDFFDTIKKNWKQALFAGIFNAFIMLFLCWDIYFFYNNFQNELRLIGIAVCSTVLFVFFIMRYYIWIILITFKLKLKQIYKNSFKLVFAGLKNNLCVLLALALVYAICYALGATGTGITQFLFLVVVIFILPGYRFFAIQFNVFPVIKKFMIDPYYKEHPDEDIEIRRSLGVLDKEQDTEYNENDLL